MRQKLEIAANVAIIVAALLWSFALCFLGRTWVDRSLDLEESNLGII